MNALDYQSIIGFGNNQIVAAPSQSSMSKEKLPGPIFGEAAPMNRNESQYKSTEKLAKSVRLLKMAAANPHKFRSGFDVRRVDHNSSPKLTTQE